VLKVSGLVLALVLTLLVASPPSVALVALLARRRLVLVPQELMSQELSVLPRQSLVVLTLQIQQRSGLLWSHWSVQCSTKVAASCLDSRRLTSPSTRRFDPLTHRHRRVLPVPPVRRLATC
jgi:hypothetical protein